MGVGESLAAARVAAGESVEDVSRATRIRGELLRRIEADDFSGCGGTVYARGHVRAIAAHLGLDAAEYVAEFDRTHAAPEAPAAREIFEREVVAMPERKGPNWTAAMAVAAGVLLIVALVSLFNTTPDASPSARQVTSSSPTPTAAAPSQPAASETPGPIAGYVPGDGVTMRVTIAAARSWVTVRADGKVIFQGTMNAGETKDFTAKRGMGVVLGNAGAVRLVVNGKDLGSPGRNGEVVRLNFTPGDPTAA
ncbi:MAG TPA: helix-turn-helix domain-containing protein [Frankiaceae bacterium]|nr:helix-turn-helix domain-containing protein [Frankiaceae bacterium]